MDVTRGVPIVAANFLGYDEQSHRRGPASAFAHWTLKGIDETVKDIYRSASRSDCRDYRLVVFSDHGQESVDSYADRFGKPLKQAVREVLSGTEGPGGGLSLHSANSDAHRENACRGTGHLFLGHRPITDKKRQGSGRERTAQIRITTMGPLGHIYLGQTTSGDPKGTPAFPTGAAGALYDLDHLACLLVEKARIPLVLYRREKSVSARTDAGRFDLIEGRAAVLGSDHPFLDQVAVDLRDLCLHTDAGDLVICGYRPETASTSFSVENGAHGGPGREETRGFVLLPPSFREDREFMRPMDLRQRIFAYLSGRNPHRVRTMPRTAPKRSETARQRLRVMTYNIHSCIHMDGRINPGRTAELIETLDPDVVALQEVDVYRARTGFTHQGEYLAEHLGMTCHFLPLLEKAGERYGLAMLSRFPATSLRNIHFPPERKELRREARGAQLAELDTPLGPVRLLNTHLGLTRGERHRQVRALFEDRWFAQALKLNLPLVVCGDFNAGPRSFVYKRLNEHVTDIQLQAARPGYPKATFFSRYPLLRLDHIFVSRQIRAERVVVPNGYEAKMVSDHLPLYGELVPV
jgi:endonuclease/exonuclease/phosphatase family metal-dependent hydrolase